MEKPPTNLKEQIKARIDFQTSEEKVQKLLTGVKSYKGFLKRADDFMLANNEPDNFKDLIKAHVQLHISDQRVEKLLDGFEDYKIESDACLLKISHTFQLALSFSFFRSGMDDESEGARTVSLSV